MEPRTSARPFVFDALGAMWDSALSGDVPSDEQRARFLLANQHAMRIAVDTVGTATGFGGMSALSRHHPLQRCLRDIHVAELHDASASAEIMLYEHLGFAERNHGVELIREGVTAVGGALPVNPGGGLLSRGHPVGATGLMQAVFAFWQLQGTIGRHLGDATLQLPEARRGLIHSHAGTGTYITVSILEKA